jgi:hypothetical protein
MESNVNEVDAQPLRWVKPVLVQMTVGITSVTKNINKTKGLALDSINVLTWVLEHDGSEEVRTSKELVRVFRCWLTAPKHHSSSDGSAIGTVHDRGASKINGS